ncbi:MAG: hypothetical protein ACLPY5_05365 [Candidatus Bathyarchaeia archaeon]
MTYDIKSFGTLPILAKKSEVKTQIIAAGTFASVKIRITLN